MRTYGRIYAPDGSYTWQEVQTDNAGHEDYIWITTLIQCLKLSIGESPFYANYGIPAQRSLIQQVFPDFYVHQTQRQFAPRFASLLVSKITSPTPIYNVNVITNQGTKIMASIPV